MQIAKLCILKKGSTAAVEGKIYNSDKENVSDTHILENAINLEQPVFTKENKIEYSKIFIQTPVYNQLTEAVKLQKNDTVVTLTEIELEAENENISFSVHESDGTDLRELDYLLEDVKLKIEDDNRNIITQVEKLKCPYKQVIKSGGKDRVAVSRRRLRCSQREEICSQKDGLLEKGIMNTPIHRMLLHFFQLKRKMVLLGCVLIIEVLIVQLVSVINKLEDLFKFARVFNVFLF